VTDLRVHGDSIETGHTVRVRPTPAQVSRTQESRMPTAGLVLWQRPPPHESRLCAAHRAEKCRRDPSGSGTGALIESTRCRSCVARCYGRSCRRRAWQPDPSFCVPCWVVDVGRAPVRDRRQVGWT
jgi:hypothetical protein